MENKKIDETNKVPYVGIRKQVVIVIILLIAVILFIIYFVSTIHWHWGKKQTPVSKNAQTASQASGPTQEQINKSIVVGLSGKPKSVSNIKQTNTKAPNPLVTTTNLLGKVPGIPFKKPFDPNSANNSHIEVISTPITSVTKTQPLSQKSASNSNLSFQSKLLKRMQTPGQKKTGNQKHKDFLKTAAKTAPVTSLFSPYGEYSVGTPYFMPPGSIISVTLETGVNSQLPGQAVALINQNVYSHDLKYLLIPKGSEVIGKYDTSIGATQTRVLLSFSLIIFPDGKELQLPGFEGASHEGYAGLHDIVDYHFWSTAKSTSLLTILDFGIQEAAGNTTGNMYPTPAQNFATSLSQNLGNVAQQIINEQISLAPTLKVEPGFTFNLIVTKNIIFKEPYR